MRANKGRIILKRLTQRDLANNASSIILPNEEESSVGEVVEVGEGCQIQRGIKIIFDVYKADKITIEKKDFYFVREEDILGFL